LFLEYIGRNKKISNIRLRGILVDRICLTQTSLTVILYTVNNLLPKMPLRITGAFPYTK